MTTIDGTGILHKLLYSHIYHVGSLHGRLGLSLGLSLGDRLKSYSAVIAEGMAFDLRCIGDRLDLCLNRDQDDLTKIIGILHEAKAYVNNYLWEKIISSPPKLLEKGEYQAVCKIFDSRMNELIEDLGNRIYFERKTIALQKQVEALTLEKEALLAGNAALARENNELNRKNEHLSNIPVATALEEPLLDTDTSSEGELLTPPRNSLHLTDTTRELFSIAVNSRNLQAQREREEAPNTANRNSNSNHRANPGRRRRTGRGNRPN